jgi:SEFIR domain
VSSIFLSYRHENDLHLRRVRQLAEQLHTAGIDVVLDQFFSEANPSGPDEGWMGWTYRQSANADKILIVASASWFRNYEGKEAPAPGLGAAWEARLIQQRLFDSAGKRSSNLRGRIRFR